MAPKKKSKKKSRTKRVQARSKASKKLAKKEASRRKVAAKPTAKRGARTRKPSATRVRAKRAARGTTFGSRVVPALSGDADSQGLSDVERADSESVSELLEEGNAFEAGVVSGVERADDADEKEVRTREFPENDVPEEYLDEE